MPVKTSVGDGILKQKILRNWKGKLAKQQFSQINLLNNNLKKSTFFLGQIKKEEIYFEPSKNIGKAWLIYAFLFKEIPKISYMFV